MTAVAKLFDDVAERMLAEDPSLERAKMMNAFGLKTRGKFFAMVQKGELVVKLPRARVDELVAARKGRRFDPGHGRLMKEWVTLRPPDKAACRTYIVEAHSFVADAQAATSATEAAADVNEGA
jgi:hypothetical protein